MYGLYKIGLTTAAAAILAIGALGTQAQASTVTEITLDKNSTASWSTSWGETIGGEALAATGDWEFLGVSGTTWNFSLSLQNNADSGGRITSWGFDTTPTASNFTISSPTTGWSAGGGQGPMTVDHCSFAGSQNCAGGGGGGLIQGPPLEFSFSFESSEDEVTLDNFLTRWQSVGTNNQLSTVLSATPATPIPLPAAGWLLLTAVGGMGLAARRRRKAS
jgi:hypothetical protein